ncbi:glycosyltransferase [Candidatus Thioglobus sp.]|nr:glycosyltransferase [Candidatus Thioglobus sp.]
MNSSNILVQPKVSIHIVSYNQKDYIAEAIESAVSQDYLNLEVVISDDASTDGTAEIVLKYQKLYPQRIFAIFNKQNMGISKNANHALKSCTGKYIAFQGGDDVLLPGKISAQVSWFEQDENRVLCGHQVEVFYQDGLQKSHLRTKKLAAGCGAKEIILNGTYGATSIMLRASELPIGGFNETIIVSDLMLWIETVARGGEFGFVDGTLAKYRRHSSNVTNDHFGNLLELKKMLLLISIKYPQFKDYCTDSLIKNVIYTGGVILLKKGEKRKARKRFIEVLTKKPLYIKGWIRLLQSI